MWQAGPGCVCAQVDRCQVAVTMKAMWNPRECDEQPVRVVVFLTRVEKIPGDEGV